MRLEIKPAEIHIVGKRVERWVPHPPLLYLDPVGILEVGDILVLEKNIAYLQRGTKRYELSRAEVFDFIVRLALGEGYVKLFKKARRVYSFLGSLPPGWHLIPESALPLSSSVLKSGNEYFVVGKRVEKVQKEEEALLKQMLLF